MFENGPAASETRPMSEQRIQFQNRIDHLVKDVKAWVEPSRVDHKGIPEEDARRRPSGLRGSGPLSSEGPHPTRVLLDPVAYDVPGAEGVVDLYLMPTYDDMASLYFYNETWMIHYAFPPSSADVIAHGNDVKALEPDRRDDHSGSRFDRRSCRTVVLTGTSTSRTSRASTKPPGQRLIG